MECILYSSRAYIPRDIHFVNDNKIGYYFRESVTMGTSIVNFPFRIYNFCEWRLGFEI